MRKKKIEEIERELGVDELPSMSLSPGDEKEAKKDVDYFQDWYEEELRKIYE